MGKYICKIIDDYDKLSNRAEEIDVFENQKQILDITKSIKDILDADRTLSGLTATQIGHNIRLFCIRFKEGVRTFINPMITKMEKCSVLNREKDPSIKGMEFLVPRSAKIRVNYQTTTGLAQDTIFQDDIAFIFQHLTQLLDGCLICDIGLHVGEEFDKMSDGDKKQLAAEYVESFESTYKEIEKEIDSNEEAKKIKRAIEFMTALAKGEISLEPIKEEPKAKEEDETVIEKPKKRKCTRKKKVVDAQE